MSDPIVAAGAESAFKVTLNTPGEVKFQCDFHVPDMAGTITVQ
jgi:plastocyanin